MSHNKFSKIGFVLSMAGSAVGLGNIWKFPTMVGNNGGSAFIAVYLSLMLTIAFVAFLGEISFGRLGGSDVVHSFYILAPKHKKLWSMAGFLMITAVLIASFYMVVIGWLLYYVFRSFSALPKTASEAGELFNTLISLDLTAGLITFTAVFFVVFYVVSRGVKSGIEKLNLIMMPSLFVLLLCLLLYSFSMGEGFSKALKFLFIPDFSAIHADTVLAALGLAFFSLSMGVCTVSTYSASLDDKTNIVKSSLSIIAIDVMVGILMGIVVFTFIFAFDADTTQAGPGLIFVSLATLFSNLGFVGNLLGIAFFISLFFAGITSAVSMIEPFAFYLINKFGMSRKKAISIVGVFVYILGVACVFSFYAETADTFALFGKSFFDILDYLTSNILMPLGAIIFSYFVGFIIKKESLYELFTSHSMSKKVFEIWYFALRYIVPFAIIAIAAYQFWALAQK
ncbi:MAG: sodium-dependent transporter [Campylobacter sp.]|nr:sodium-dependent transporter [Campylobacter sp.]